MTFNNKVKDANRNNVMRLIIVFRYYVQLVLHVNSDKV